MPCGGTGSCGFAGAAASAPRGVPPSAAIPSSVLRCSRRVLLLMIPPVVGMIVRPRSAARFLFAILRRPPVASHRPRASPGEISRDLDWVTSQIYTPCLTIIPYPFASSISDSTLCERFPQSHLPELRLAGRGGRAASLRGTARSGSRRLVRPERATWGRCLGCVDPPADQRMCAVRAGHLGEHAGARGRLLSPRMESGGEQNAGHGRRQGVLAAGGDRRHNRRQRPRAREIPGRAMDAPPCERNAGRL